MQILDGGRERSTGTPRRKAVMPGRCPGRHDHYYNTTSRGGSPDPPHTCVISPPEGNCRAVGQETHRARGYEALQY
jgi:hypothetical protein